MFSEINELNSSENKLKAITPLRNRFNIIQRSSVVWFFLRLLYKKLQAGLFWLSFALPFRREVSRPFLLPDRKKKAYETITVVFSRCPI